MHGGCKIYTQNWLNFVHLSSKKIIMHSLFQALRNLVNRSGQIAVQIFNELE